MRCRIRKTTGVATSKAVKGKASLCKPETIRKKVSSAVARQITVPKTLGQQHVDQRQPGIGEVGAHAAERTRRDEGGVVVEREEDIDRPSRDRQGRDHCREQRPASLGQQRTADDDGGRKPPSS
jgi:hypothetical protein